MEHPIPQDVTGFQFKLIGNMTIKQFAYLATGSVMAWIFFSLPLSGFIKYPLSFFFAFLGVALAFIPIEQRPMDVMLKNFINALFNSNQFVYQKQGGVLAPQIHSLPKKTAPVGTKTLPREKLQRYLQSIPKTSHGKIDDKESRTLQNLATILKAGASSLKQTTSAPPSSPSDANSPPRIISAEEEEKKKKVSELDLAAQAIKKDEVKAQEAKPAPPAQPPKQEPQPPAITPEEVHQKALDLQKQLNEALLAKQKLEEQLRSMQRKSSVLGPVYSPSPTVPPSSTPNVRSVPEGMGKNVGLPIAPFAPNIIVGIIKDPRGNVLSNILVEIKDQDGNPVRAFKTNALGQFAAVTPLLNGSYTISFEDPQNTHQFDAIVIEAKGEIISPLEVISHDQREELRKELFGEN